MPARSAAKKSIPRSARRKSRPASQPRSSRRKARRAAGMESRRPLSGDRQPPSSSATSNRPTAECVAFEKAYKGKLADLAAKRRPPRSARRVKRYEALDDLLGRVVSYASLIYAGNTTDPARAKFYGDVQERITGAVAASAVLRRSNSTASTTPCSTPRCSEPALGHYRPWIEDMRKEKPYQLEDRVEQLFHEKSVTGYSAWNRLFDETIAALRFKIGGKDLPASSRRSIFLQDADGKKRKAAAASAGQDLQGEPAPVRADHQHARQGQGNLRPLARLQGRRRRAASVEPRRARGGRCAGRRGARRLSAAVAPLLRAEGEMVRQEDAAALGPQRAAAEGRAAHDPLDRGARHRADRLWRVLAEDGGGRRPLLRASAGSTRRCGPASSRAPSRIRPCRRRILMCCSTIRASRAT